MPELDDVIVISKGTIHRTLTENLDMGKLHENWVQCLLKLENKKEQTAK